MFYWVYLRVTIEAVDVALAAHGSHARCLSLPHVPTTTLALLHAEHVNVPHNLNTTHKSGRACMTRIRAFKLAGNGDVGTKT